jgi:spore coat polysaccharide biosynthesis protein SpsF (cytidylyltransferase family)
MKGYVFVYARLDSSRLPRKALLPLGKDRLIDVVMRRASSFGLGRAVLLTTNRNIDDELATYVEGKGYHVVRGDPFDLIKRTVTAIEQTSADFFFRVNGDSPLVDYHLARKVANFAGEYQLISNLITRTFPYGIAIEMISSEIYLNYSDTYESIDAEHVTKHIYRDFSSIKTLSIVADRDDSNISLTIDTIEDYIRLKGLFSGDNIQKASELTYWKGMNLKKPRINFLKI